MAAPALRIPVSANLDAFKKQMEDTSSFARAAARKVAQHFLEMNKELATGAAQGAFDVAGVAALKYAGRIALVVGAAKLMGDAIGSARQQLADMVDLQNKAQNVGVSSSFLQSVRAESKKLQVDVGELDNALEHAFNATKDKSPVDLSAWDTGKDRITDVERALRIYNETVTKAAGQRLEGLVLFRDADTQEKKVQAVLKAMIQLEGIGQKAAALDLGEKMFGTAFVDRIRQGRTSAESFLSTIQNAKGDADGIFPDVLVQRAKEMDDQLKLAHQRLSTALKPSWDDLADVLLTIKGYWADTVGLIAKAVDLVNQIPKYIPLVPDSSLQGKRDALDTVNRRLNGTSGWTETYGILASRKTLEDQRDRLQAEIAQMTKGDQYGPTLPSQSRGTGDRPTRKPTNSGADRFDTGVDAINKRIAALQAEAQALDLGTEARDRAKIAAQLETVAKQANAAAGKGANVITDEQRKVIDEVAAAYGNATVAMEKAKVASQIKFDKQTALLSNEDVAIASQLRGIYPDIATALNSVEAAGIRAANGMREVVNVGKDINRGLFVEFGQNLRQGMSTFDAFKNAGLNALGKISDKLMSMVADNLWNAAFGGSGGLGSIVGNLFRAGSSAAPSFAGASALYADGGIIRGPGGSRSDSILARVSNGEFITNAAMTARYRPLLEAINSGKLPAFADGGMVSLPRMPPLMPEMPSLLPARGGSGGMSVSVGGPTITIQGDASEKTVALIKQALVQYNREFPARAVAAVIDAQKRRMF